MSVQCTWFWGQFVVARGAGKECLSINQFFYHTKLQIHTEVQHFVYHLSIIMCSLPDFNSDNVLATFVLLSFFTIFIFF